MDRQYAYEHVLYERSRLDLGRHRDMDVAQGKIDMVMKTMAFKAVIGVQWTAGIENRPEGRVVHLTWKGVKAGDANQDVTVELVSLTRENAEVIQAIAQVMTC